MRHKCAGLPLHFFKNNSRSHIFNTGVECDTINSPPSSGVYTLRRLVCFLFIHPSPPLYVNKLHQQQKYLYPSLSPLDTALRVWGRRAGRSDWAWMMHSQFGAFSTCLPFSLAKIRCVYTHWVAHLFSTSHSGYSDSNRQKTCISI